jgi:hypothetical protein
MVEINTFAISVASLAPSPIRKTDVQSMANMLDGTIVGIVIPATLSLQVPDSKQSNYGIAKLMTIKTSIR